MFERFTDRELEKKKIGDVLRSEIEDYGPSAERLAGVARLLHGAMICNGEGQELMDAIKKHVYYGKPLDVVNIKEEAADICFGLCVICDHFGWTISELQDTVIAKLKVRYPDKFAEDKAINRDLDAERESLES